MYKEVTRVSLLIIGPSPRKKQRQDDVFTEDSMSPWQSAHLSETSRAWATALSHTCGTSCFHVYCFKVKSKNPILFIGIVSCMTKDVP
jgi:hypothetical protein